MKISTRGEYGVRAMLDLALNYGAGPVTLRSIAERQSISEHYLEQLFASLRKSGIVNSIRGAQGGYELARSPGQIKVGDIIKVLEGPLGPVDCVNDESECSCDKADTCVARMLWQRVKESVEEVLDSITLQDMIDKAEELKSKSGAHMYYI